MTISVDDGSPLDWQVAKLLSKYGHRATFYWSKYNDDHEVMDETEMRRFMRVFPEFDYQSHTYQHKVLTRERNPELELSLGYEWIKSLTGKKPQIICVPKGYWSSEIAKEAYKVGFKYLRGVWEEKHDPGPIKVFWCDGQIYPGRIKQDSTHTFLHSHELEKYNLWDDFEEWLKVIPKSVTNLEYVNSQ